MAYSEQQLSTILTIQDARNLGYCVSGCKEAVERHKTVLNLSFKQVVRQGIPVRDVVGLGDPFFDRLVRGALNKRNGE